MVHWMDWDRSLLLWINSPAGQNGVIDGFVYGLGESNLVKGGIFLAFYWWLWFDRDGSQRRDVVVALAAAIITAVLSRGLQIGLPFHLRPLHTPGLGTHLPYGVDPTILNTFSSFPSDHAMLFSALSVPLWWRSRWLGVAAMLWTALLIGVPRIYLGYHFPSDVIAGMLLGVVVMVVLCRLIGRMRLPDRVVVFSKTHPAAFYPVAFLVTFELGLLFADVRHLTLDAVHIAKMLVA